MQMSSKKSVVAIAVTTVALTVGNIGIGQAASKTKVVSKKITRTSTTGEANPTAKLVHAGEAISLILSTLVTKGTITQAQADEITAAFIAGAPIRGVGGQWHRGSGRSGMGAAPAAPAQAVKPSA
jgi:hypothetical protein